MGEPLLIVFVILTDVLMYVTLPLHARLLHVLVRPSKGVALDGSFLTLMINTTIVNLLYSIEFCLIQAPAATGVLFEFYKTIGPYVSHTAMIKATTLILLGSVFHLVLAISRFTAIRVPTKHVRIWQKLPFICGGLWIVTFLISIPLLLPGSTASLESVNIFALPNVEFTFLGNYFTIYSLGSSLIAAVFEIITIVCYLGMISGFRKFIYGSSSGSTEVNRMKLGVLRTTVAAMCTSVGSWIIVFFFATNLGYQLSSGKSLVTPEQFTSIFGLLNAINNVLTPWVLLFAFPNVRRSIFTSKALFNNKIESTPHTISDGRIASKRVSKSEISAVVF